MKMNGSNTLRPLLLGHKAWFYDTPISHKDKNLKPLFTFPKHIAPIAVIAESTLLAFEQGVAFVKAKLLRRRTTASVKTI